jgi:hypothetical protein
MSSNPTNLQLSRMYTGEEFRERYPNKRLFKLVGNDGKTTVHRGKAMDFSVPGEYYDPLRPNHGAGGIYFTDHAFLYYWGASLGYWNFCIARIPSYATVFEYSHNGITKWKTSYLVTTSAPDSLSNMFFRTNDDGTLSVSDEHEFKRFLGTMPSEAFHIWVQSACRVDDACAFQ